MNAGRVVRQLRLRISPALRKGASRAGRQLGADHVPGKGWNSLIRLYAPLQPWFNKTWKPGDFELVD